eukprot:COSAG02_NODE_38508_length_428_cov_0.814590_1_plen_87_part_01
MWREYRQVCAARVVWVVVQATPVIPAPPVAERTDDNEYPGSTSGLALPRPAIGATRGVGGGGPQLRAETATNGQNVGARGGGGGGGG